MAPAAVTENSRRGGRAPARTCDALTRRGQGPPCKRGAGWGTDHPGYGNCKRHGGATPSGKAHAAKLAALDSARADYGGEVELSPLDALLYTVRRGAQLVSYWQRAALAADNMDEFALASAQESRALGELNRWSKAAVDAGVSTLQVELAARLAERVGAAAEDALAALERAIGHDLTIEQRSAFAASFGEGLARLEQGDIEITTHDV